MARTPPPGLVGRSPCIRRVRQRIQALAHSDLPVLVRGETGTGKELTARLIHARSPRAAGPFVPVNCAALPEALLESELFGHERGAFTGAHTRRRGRFEQANGGTLFLDEIGDMSPLLQAKVLRALECGEIERLGAEGTTQVDVRIVAATHRDLEAMREAGTIRDDLFYRIAGAEVELPPLRERGEDIDLLAEHFAHAAARKHGTEARLTPDFLTAVRAYPWPGNVRELAHAVELAYQLSSDGVLRAEDLPRRVREREVTAADLLDQRAVLPTLAEMERELIQRALELSGGNKTAAARMLGISRQALSRRRSRDHE